MEQQGQPRARPPEWWPPPNDEPIGEERAKELVQYLRERAPDVLEVATAPRVGRGQYMRVDEPCPHCQGAGVAA